MKLLSLEDTIKKHQLQPNKKLGQHFLSDATLLAQIVEYGGDLSGVNVLEIGAGPGGLTRAIMNSQAKSLSVVELDSRCIPALMELKVHYEPTKQLTIIEADALQFCIGDVAAPRAIIANLPYNVGTALLVNWLQAIHEHGAEIVESIVIMLQQEVVARIIAGANDDDYGRLSVICNWLCEVEHCLDVPPSAFTPPPKVMSSVVRLVPRPAPAFVAEFSQLEKFLHAAFGQRRKMLRGSLKSWCENPAELLEKAGIDGARRAETLSLAEIGKLIALKHY